MPQIKAVLGHVAVETAKRKRTCSRHKNGAHAHDIARDEDCLVVTDADGSKHNYCAESAEAILDRADQDLAGLRSRMGL
jgi:hypothetical protein